MLKSEGVCAQQRSVSQNSPMQQYRADRPPSAKNVGVDWTRGAPKPPNPPSSCTVQVGVRLTRAITGRSVVWRLGNVFGRAMRRATIPEQI